MRSLTVEFQRFGDPTGVVRLSDRYIRTAGNTTPAEEVSFGVCQENLTRGMEALDYKKFELAPDRSDSVRDVAERFLLDIARPLKSFLLANEPQMIQGDGRCQIDIVTHALELAQLPFEILEETHPNLVITRRIRQPWPPPLIVRDYVPKVLFAWAEPLRTAGSRRRMKVPHDRHRTLLKALLKDWGEGALVEVKHATKAKLASMLDGSFTHVHLLAHGVGPERRSGPPETIDLTRPPAPSTLLALEDEEGTIGRCPPEEIAELFLHKPRPESLALATCHSAGVDPIRSGATFAHVLHAAGVPVVVASQLALTEAGSDELIRTFLAGVVEGDDPRDALRDCRDRLRRFADKTYYDRVALVGYVHVDGGLEQRLWERRFKVALTHLTAASEGAEKAALVITPEQRTEAEKIGHGFKKVRKELAALKPAPMLTKAQREELRGLLASSLKREAEAAWRLSRKLSGDDSRDWLERSREMLRAAAEAYRRAAEISRDHHWTWVQWLVLEAVDLGSLKDFEEDWIVAKVAARDAAESQTDEAVWGWCSLGELHLLAPLVGRDAALSDAEAKKCLDQLVTKSRQLGKSFPIDSTRDQLDRYRTWWGEDSHWKLPKQVVERAIALQAHLMDKSKPNEEAPC